MTSEILRIIMCKDAIWIFCEETYNKSNYVKQTFCKDSWICNVKKNVKQQIQLI